MNTVKVLRVFLMLSTVVILVSCGGSRGGDGEFRVSITLPLSEPVPDSSPGMEPSRETAIILGRSMVFKCSVSNGKSPYTYSWRFEGSQDSFVEDGNPLLETFTISGSYTLTLTVTDSQGAIAQDWLFVNVQ